MTGPYFPLLHLYPWQYPQGPELNQRPHHVEITSSRLISETNHKRLINQLILKACIQSDYNPIVTVPGSG